MPNSNGTTTTNPTQGVPNSNGINSNAQQIPINHGTATAGMDMPQGYHHGQQQQQPGYASPSSGGGGVGGGGRQQFSPHFQGFGFDPDIDDMFNDAGLRGHLRGMRDPFGTFGSHFPQFGSLGRRRAGGAASGAGNPLAGDGMQRDDFFERLPPEFRQFIPEGFGIRRGGSGSGVSSGAPESPRVQIPQPQFYQTYVQPATNPPNSPPVQTRTVCDAAIQTEDPSAGSNRSEVDGHVNPESLNQHGLRNTVDMGVKAPAEGEGTNSRSHSAPPQQQEPIYPHEVPIQQHQPAYNSQGTGTQRNTPPPAQQQRQFPPSQQPPQFQKAYYPPPNQPQQPAAPQTPGGSYIRTIPIFVEGRSEPLINHKDIPQAEAQPTQAFAQAKASSAHPPQQPQQQHHQPAPQPQQQHQAPQHHANRPTPINTQQQPTAQQQKGPPPATPHTMDSINKIQDIQRDVLNLMTEVEKFGGTRQGKEYAYLDEMLTRNLLKLDTIDTQGKESIRLARKEAIKCIQASINVLEAKAEENAKTAQPEEAVIEDGPAPAADAGQNPIDEQQPIDVSNVHEPIPLPPPDSLKSTGSSETVPAAATDATAAAESKETSASSETKETPDATTTTTTVTKSGSGSSTKGSETVAEGKTE